MRTLAQYLAITAAAGLPVEQAEHMARDVLQRHAFRQLAFYVRTQATQEIATRLRFAAK